MANLLYADFYKLRKDKLFLLFLALVTGFCLYKGIVTYSSFLPTENEYMVFPLQEIPIIAFVVSIVTSFFVCTDYSDGVIRNKIITGCSRKNIYLSNTIVTSVIALSMTLAFLFCGIGVVLQKKIPLSIYLIFILVALVTSTVFSAVSTFISTLTTKKAVAAVICIAVSASMFLATSYISGELGQPEFNREIATVNGEEYDGFSMIPENSVLTYCEYPNPTYPTGTKRIVLEFANSVLPTTQLSAIANIWVNNTDDSIYIISQFSTKGEGDEPIVSPLDVLAVANPIYSLCFSIFITVLGVYLFKRKSIN